MDFARLIQELGLIFIVTASITAILEVVKDTYKSVRKSDLQPRAVKLLNLFLAMWWCFGAEYGAMGRMLQINTAELGGGVSNFDYFATACIVYMGAGGFYKLVAAEKAKLEAAISEAKNGVAK